MLLGQYCGNLTALLSAHQSIGVPQPLIMFGTDAQKEKYLPLFAKGNISAFALTEEDVGSDPSKIKTEAVLNEAGTHYELNGEKLWCTNGLLASHIVVMARTPSAKNALAMTAFIVAVDAWRGNRYPLPLYGSPSPLQRRDPFHQSTDSGRRCGA